MPRLYANDAETTLAVAITSVDTSLTLTSATNFPAPNAGAGEYAVLTLINGTTRERIRYTTLTGAVVSGVTRGQEGTTAAAFPIGATVGVYVTEVGMERLESPHVQVTVAIPPGSFGQATFTVADSDAAVGRRVVMQLEPNAEYDLDEIVDYTVRGTILTTGTITGIIAARGPIIGDFRVSYTLE